MIRLMGMLTGILITLSLYLLYLNINMQASPAAPEIVPDQALEATRPSPVEPPAMVSGMPDQDDEAGTSQPMAPGEQASMDTGEAEASLLSGSLEAVFWEPFHSRYSASGFARRMTIATGIPVHVVSDNKHEYRVAFHYLDEEDRTTKISIIESITGLELTP